MHGSCGIILKSWAFRWKWQRISLALASRRKWARSYSGTNALPVQMEHAVLRYERLYHLHYPTSSILVL